MQGKTVVITGATSGIGAVAAESLAAQGARIVLVARDAARAEATLTRLRAIAPAPAHRAHLGDLALLADARRLGEEIKAAEPHIDVLINNAGAMYGQREETADGLERTFATNHLAYFVLTLALHEPLQAAGAARVVSTASRAHQGQTLDFDDLQSRRYQPIAVYGRSKLCNILFTRELARRWADTGITANCFHPGFVASRFGDGSGGWLAAATRAAKLFAISPQRGADTLIYLATAPEVAGSSGGYFVRRRAVEPSPQARDALSAARLWDASLKLADL